MTEQEKYLIVANYARVVEKFGMTPYSVWMNLSKGKTVDDIVGYLGGENSENSDSTADNLTDTQSEKVQSEIYRNITSAQQLIDENKNSATVQITNGMFKRADIFIISAASCGSRHRYSCNSDVCKAHIDHISAAETQYRSKCIYLSI